MLMLVVVMDIRNVLLGVFFKIIDVYNVFWKIGGLLFLFVIFIISLFEIWNIKYVNKIMYFNGEKYYW